MTLNYYVQLIILCSPSPKNRYNNNNITIFPNNINVICRMNLMLYGKKNDEISYLLNKICMCTICKQFAYISFMSYSLIPCYN